MSIKKLLWLLAGVFCIAGVALCVAMLISAVAFLEWGRVILYAVCLAVCVEGALLVLSKLKSPKS